MMATVVNLPCGTVIRFRLAELRNIETLFARNGPVARMTYASSPKKWPGLQWRFLRSRDLLGSCSTWSFSTEDLPLMCAPFQTVRARFDR